MFTSVPMFVTVIETESPGRIVGLADGAMSFAEGVDVLLALKPAQLQLIRGRRLCSEFRPGDALSGRGLRWGGKEVVFVFFDGEQLDLEDVFDTASKRDEIRRAGV